MRLCVLERQTLRRSHDAVLSRISASLWLMMLQAQRLAGTLSGDAPLCIGAYVYEELAARGANLYISVRLNVSSVGSLSMYPAF